MLEPLGRQIFHYATITNSIPNHLFALEHNVDVRRRFTGNFFVVKATFATKMPLRQVYLVGLIHVVKTQGALEAKNVSGVNAK
jgi:hypothetical protein